MKGIIIYKSKYGSTKQFVDWLNEEISFEIVSYKNVPYNLSDYEIIIIASSINKGKVSLRNIFTQKWDQIKDKNVVLMLTSGSTNIDFINKVIEKSLFKEIIEKIKVFPVGGRYIFDRMSTIDRNIIKFIAFFTRNKETKKGMLTERDDVDKDGLNLLLKYLKEKNNI